MVKELKANNKKTYQCELCGYKFYVQERAEKREAWEKEHKSCNLEIISHGFYDA